MVTRPCELEIAVLPPISTGSHSWSFAMKPRFCRIVRTPGLTQRYRWHWASCRRRRRLTMEARGSIWLHSGADPQQHANNLGSQWPGKGAPNAGCGRVIDGPVPAERQTIHSDTFRGVRRTWW